MPKKMLAAFWNAQESINADKAINESEMDKDSSKNILLDFVRLLELALLLFRYRGRSHHIALQAKRWLKSVGIN